MSTRSYERGFAWSGLVLASMAALAFAVLNSAQAGAAGSVERRDSRIQLELDIHGTMERITLENLHEMSVGETRTLAAESGSPVVVTRDENGFEVEIDGESVRVIDRFSGEDLGNGMHFFRKEISDEGDGQAKSFVFHAGDGDGDGADQDVVFFRRMAGEGDAGGGGFAWSTEDGEALNPFGVEGTISRLEKNARFQALDEGTRTTVLEALRESAPERLHFAGAPGEGRRKRVLVVESQGDEEN